MKMIVENHKRAWMQYWIANVLVAVTLVVTAVVFLMMVWSGTLI